MSDRPIRVCHLGKYYPPYLGGIELHTQTLARTQVEMGLDVRVIVVNHSDSGRPARGRPAATPTVEEEDEGVALTRIGRRAGVPGFDLCPGLVRLLRREQEQGTDIFHMQGPNPTMMLALAKLKPNRARVVITHQGDIVRQKVTGAMIRPIERAVYGHAAKVIATSPLYAEASALLRRNADRVVVVPMGNDLRPFADPGAEALEHAASFRAKYGSEGPIWLGVGRLIYYKGFHVAIRALTKVPGRLVLVGVGPLEGQLRQQAEELGVADRVTFHGRAFGDVLVGLYHASTAFWFPSCGRAEGFGLVQVEAMACGKPVLNTFLPASGVSWVSKHEESGLTVPIEDADALAVAANRLLDEPGLIDRLGAQGRERALREFDHRVMSRRVIEVYESALGRASAPEPVAVLPN
ncbi:MAG TPA: glycosyltransferase [Isosphaeraceae bacterium]|jgi:rhamnosyl/mannosyltransferase|nr:glycosyltransferase [Isosphaeraceae bacterium]